ncbi:EamA-like transporter family protein [Halomonas elongata]|uniref:EamA-like transporter family protein n=1 Tax=Halomonas elongata TaxID=2746 RepID=A0A1B8NWD7_HALEL|nr:EamA-like transporter family protein [Halomonas elongata]
MEWVGATGLAAGIYVGLFEMGIAFVLWQLAMRTVSRTARISNLIFLSPPISLVLLFFIVGEPVLPSTLLGLVLILGGLGLQQRQKTPAEPAEARS